MGHTCSAHLPAGEGQSGSWRGNTARRRPPTFAQVVGAHEAGLGGPGPDPLPGLVLGAPEPAEQDVPLALVLKALAVGVVAGPGACGGRGTGTVTRGPELKAMADGPKQWESAPCLQTCLLHRGLRHPHLHPYALWGLGGGKPFKEPFSAPRPRPLALW